MIRTKVRPDLTRWHLWFAWRPVSITTRIENGAYCTVTIWLENIWRRERPNCHYSREWEYSRTRLTEGGL